MSIFKLSKKGVALALASTLGLGVAGQASADVYGGSTLDLDNLLVTFNAIGGSANLYTFNTNADAILDGNPDLSSGASNCVGDFSSGFTTCTGAGTPNDPRLSGTVQNAPGGGGTIRAENDYALVGANNVNYSNAEAAIDQAVLLGDAVTRARTVSESNLDSAVTAQANSNVNSNTTLMLTFALANGGSFDIDFTAILDARAEVTEGDNGLAQANSGLTLALTDGQGTVYARWVPDGTNFVQECGAGLTCTATDAFNPNVSLSSSGLADTAGGNGAFNLSVDGLSSGTYNLVLAGTTSTNLFRVPVPVPGTLFLMGAGLLAAGGLRRKK